MHDLTGFQRDLLVVIAGLDEPLGLEIKDELDKYYAADVNHGRLYPNLDSLVEEGLVEKGQKDDRTNEYTLSDAGAEMIAERRSWEENLVEDLE